AGALLASPRAAQAAEPPGKPKPPARRGYLDPLFYRDALAGGAYGVSQLEIVKTLRAVSQGSQMGPGAGWFGPGGSRYGWQWLAERYDRNHDGRITTDEIPGAKELFARLDRTRSGSIQRGDLDWSDNAPFVRMSGMARMWAARINAASNGRVTREE